MKPRRVKAERDSFRLQEDIEDTLCRLMPALNFAIDEMDEWLEGMSDRRLRTLHRIICND